MENQTVVAPQTERITFEKARKFTQALARARATRRVTSDDVVEYINQFFPGQTLGAALGVIFRGPEWQATGEKVSSKVPANHRRKIAVWQLKEGF